MKAYNVSQSPIERGKPYKRVIATCPMDAAIRVARFTDSLEFHDCDVKESDGCFMVPFFYGSRGFAVYYVEEVRI